MSAESEDIPFPSMEDMPEIPMLESSSPSPEPVNISATNTGSSTASHASSSKLTSSDKLSALPQPTSIDPTPTFVNSVRPPGPASGGFNRGWRRSLDAMTSFPTFFTREREIFAPDPHVWAGSSNVLNAGFESGFRRSSHPQQGSLRDSFSGDETPRQRVSFDGERSTATARPVTQAFSGSRGSDPSASSPLRASPFRGHRDGERLTGTQIPQANSHSPSRPTSRATSPLRILQQLSSGFHRHRSEPEEPFVPVDPFRFKSRFTFGGQAPRPSDDVEMAASASSGAYDCDDLLPLTSMHSIFYDSRLFCTDLLPRELYLNFLLRLPAMYFSRVARIFEDANVSKPDIQRMINTSGGSLRETSGFTAMPIAEQSNQPHGGDPGIASGVGISAQVGSAPAAAALMHTPFPDEWTPPRVSPALMRFKHSWEAFIDSLVKEWKTLNVVSALLASAILTIFQVPNAANDPVTRTLALLSLISALFSLSYGCMYIVRFGMMRSMFHASRWAEQAQKTKTLIWWNVWVLLAMPVVWMAWSMLLFISAILSFVWRTGSITDPTDPVPLGPRLVLVLRILITFVFALGMIYLLMIIKTLKKYGSHQSSTKAILLAGLSLDTHGGVANPRDAVSKPSADDGVGRTSFSDEIMERRGRSRDREFNASAHKKSGKHRQWSLRGSSRRDVGSKRGKRGTLAPLFGFGVGGSKAHPRNEDDVVEVELDFKVPAEILVKEVDK